jgi:hypothetical protein
LSAHALTPTDHSRAGTSCRPLSLHCPWCYPTIPIPM